ncbi:unnamed protein product [Blepharisma stoltei]|uniref:Uncharacterized protein n=1 Tax=Blepharisma stoltei TaxID=1481888 RepID=A0AAU9K319_9CILI|nr:unnamed protein product [Blepharisma stoltei]
MIPNYNGDSREREVQTYKGQVRCDSILFHCFFGIPFMIMYFYGTWDVWFLYITIFFPYAMIGQIGLCVAGWKSGIKTVSTYSSLLRSTKIVFWVLLVGVGLGFIASFLSNWTISCDEEEFDSNCENDENIAEGLTVITGILCFIFGITLVLLHYSFRHAKKLLKAMKNASQPLNSSQPLNAPLIMNQEPFVYPQANLIIPQSQQNYYQNNPQFGYPPVPPSGYPYVQPVAASPLPPAVYQKL